MRRGLRTRDLQEAFIKPLGERVIRHTSLPTKPLDVDLRLPFPPRLRVYLFNLVGGFGTKRSFEYKCVLRVRGQSVGDYGSFEHADDRILMLVGYTCDLDVFVLWDASLHARFKNGGNIQVRTSTVLEAAAVGEARQMRDLTCGSTEAVIACQSWNLARAIEHRVNTIGGVPEEEWATLPK